MLPRARACRGGRVHGGRRRFDRSSFGSAAAADRNVPGDGERRIERVVGVLKHQLDRPPRPIAGEGAERNGAHVAPFEGQPAGIGRCQPGGEA
eukprot:gene21014-21771_t